MPTATSAPEFVASTWIRAGDAAARVLRRAVEARQRDHLPESGRMVRDGGHHDGR